MLNLAAVLEDSAREFPGRDAVVHGGARLTYRELEAQASKVANALIDRGIVPGDTVALSCPNLPLFPIVYYGILKAGVSSCRSTSCSRTARSPTTLPTRRRRPISASRARRNCRSAP